MNIKVAKHQLIEALDSVNSFFDKENNFIAMKITNNGIFLKKQHIAFGKFAKATLSYEGDRPAENAPRTFVVDGNLLLSNARNITASFIEMHFGKKEVVMQKMITIPFYNSDFTNVFEDYPVLSKGVIEHFTEKIYITAELQKYLKEVMQYVAIKENPNTTVRAPYAHKIYFQSNNQKMTLMGCTGAQMIVKNTKLQLLNSFVLDVDIIRMILKLKVVPMSLLRDFITVSLKEIPDESRGLYTQHYNKYNFQITYKGITHLFSTHNKDYVDVNIIDYAPEDADYVKESKCADMMKLIDDNNENMEVQFGDLRYDYNLLNRALTSLGGDSDIVYMQKGEMPLIMYNNSTIVFTKHKYYPKLKGAC